MGVGITAGVEATGAADVVTGTAAEGVMTSLLVVLAGALGVGCPIFRVSRLQ